MGDLPLKISWSGIVDFFSCPVCMCELKQTYITPCGHRYCEKCIKECVDRHMKCPCCNKELRQQDLIKDPTFDDLVATAYREKDVAEKEYFDKLMNAVEGEVRSTEANHLHSPVEMVLKKHLKESLATHERYHQELRRELERRRACLQAEHARLIESLTEENLPRDDVFRRKQALQTDLDLRQNALEGDMHHCAELVAKAFDRYLTEHIPQLSILPVTVTLSVLNKNIQLPNVVLRPESSLEDIKQILMKEMESRGDKIVSFSEEVTFLYFGPFARRTVYEMHRMAADIVEHKATHPDITVLPAKSRPVLQCGAKAGGEIAVYGMVSCESDLPKSCFAATFQASQHSKIDYFSCNDCGINWICRSCMEVCHRDHHVAPYIMNHQPTWACCYCPKKKKCVITVDLSK